MSLLETFLNSPAAIIIMVGALVGGAASLLGVFLILRQTSMLTDAISHSVLLGIVLMFFVTQNSTSPWLFVGASLAGLLTVVLTEGLIGSGRLKQDASIGLVFPAMFALAVLLINLFARNVHIDSDAVLLGEIAFSWLDVTELGRFVVPRSLLVMGAITLVNALFVTLFYKELKLVTFDPALAVALGVSPTFFHYALLSLTSVTAVGAFDAVGAVLFVAFVVVPPAAAYLLTDTLWRMIAYSLVIAVASSTLGYILAVRWDVSIGGMMACATGLFLALAFVLSPRHGFLVRLAARRQQARNNARRMLMVHLYTHERNPASAEENAQRALETHLRWPTRKARAVLGESLARGLITRGDHHVLHLTEQGRVLAREVLEPWRGLEGL